LKGRSFSMPTIYDLTWRETSFLSKLRLFFAAISKHRKDRKSSELTLRAASFSAVSSTYYSIAATARAHLDEAKACENISGLFWLALWGLTWAPLGGWCHLRMRSFSDMTYHMLGYTGMTADQLDIRQSILVALGGYKDALECIEKAMLKNGVKAHTRGLLFVGKAHIAYNLYDFALAREAVASAARLAHIAMTAGQINQAARIYRKCADILDAVSGSDEDPRVIEWRNLAQILARQSGSSDQIMKQGQPILVNRK